MIVDSTPALLIWRAWTACILGLGMLLSTSDASPKDPELPNTPLTIANVADMNSRGCPLMTHGNAHEMGPFSR